MNSLERVKILLRKGEYENAFLLIREIPHEKDDAFNYIYNTCKNSLADQYIYLMLVFITIEQPKLIRNIRV